jgi:hypothetical protein
MAIVTGIVSLESSIFKQQDDVTAIFESTHVSQLLSPTKQWIEVDILKRGSEAIREIDNELGLSFDQQDMIYYTHLFRDVLKRNPTSVELFDLAQSNSEHSRHWFFRV